MLDTNIAVYETIKEYKENIDDNETTRVMRLAYKKVLFVAARDFVYMRWAKLIAHSNTNPDKLEYLIISVSVPD